MATLNDLLNVLEFEPVCRARISKTSYDYIAHGTDDEFTLRRNREAFQWMTLRPRVATDVSQMDLSLDLLGQKIEMPILICPTGSHSLAHPEGELATARAAGAMKTIMAVSSASSYPLEKIAAAATGPLWRQLSAETDLDSTLEEVQKAVALGCKAIVFTIDNKYNSNRERLFRNRTAQSDLLAAVSGDSTRAARRTADRPNPYRLGWRHTARVTWPYLEQLASRTKAPLVLKGILRPDDAQRAAQHGAAGIIVSNHGGRYLGADPATIEVLPEIVDAVGAKIPVLIDGGFRRGTDVLKALAIGARAVMVGRPPLWGLGAFGEAGTQRVLEILQTELALAMGLSGCPNLASIDRSVVRIDRRAG
jgi:isopentenyl diphosphate isomerase/L-lactate dehydrogenase-like FMN-dependent dehydrogenase